MADIPTDAQSWSSTPGSNNPGGSTVIGAGLDDNLRAIQAGVKGASEFLSTVAGTNTITAAHATLTAYASGLRVQFIPANANTGATTINVQSLGAKNIFQRGVACVGGEIMANVPCELVYDGTQFNIVGPLNVLNGTTTNDSAAAGKVGEVLDASVASGNAQGLTNNTLFNCVTLALTAGDWEVSGMGAFTPNAATTFTYCLAALSTVSLSAPELQTAQVSFPNTMTGGSTQQLVPPPLRVSLAAGANVYLVTAAAFAVNVMNTWGKIHARRVR